MATCDIMHKSESFTNDVNCTDIPSDYTRIMFELPSEIYISFHAPNNMILKDCVYYLLKYVNDIGMDYPNIMFSELSIYIDNLLSTPDELNFSLKKIQFINYTYFKIVTDKSTSNTFLAKDIYKDLSTIIPNFKIVFNATKNVEDKCSFKT